MSCNGCRVLRKACSDDCVIRPCLEWIKTADSQANATFFLAKFYGRAGLINLINAGTENLRPALFRSLLYEACGRMVNPVYGSIGLLWFDNWNLCEMAVDAVLKGMDVANNNISRTEFTAKSAGPAGPLGSTPCRDYESTGRPVEPNETSGSRSRVRRAAISVGTTPEGAAHRSCLFSWEIGESSSSSPRVNIMSQDEEAELQEMDLTLSLGSKLAR